MPSIKGGPDSNGVNRLVADVLARRKEAEKGYRERALKLFPPICGHCGREFSGKRLRELTVHHKDHNHDNNPPDGSNWELLCLYCHENAHGRQAVADAYDPSGGPDREPASGFGHKPFAGLDTLLNKKE
ncbi:YajD family HNH nuclease [Desulfosudis oleivorans]|uniref:Putative HNH nuclease YajD n=1 Tax=Desulfosudis oleivorans (strain DSM 6200 / JCM 39069 / Hxd3) TaxID=96561 RepID=A8ZVU0_DESOH|nr:YajD family HNH nuclease [Desulfosudis oleivorans]ABW66649.1 HNH endonuclease [Desulfosudis oleivorans Hxd3]